MYKDNWINYVKELLFTDSSLHYLWNICWNLNSVPNRKNTNDECRLKMKNRHVFSGFCFQTETVQDEDRCWIGPDFVHRNEPRWSRSVSRWSKWPLRLALCSRDQLQAMLTWWYTLQYMSNRGPDCVFCPPGIEHCRLVHQGSLTVPRVLHMKHNASAVRQGSLTVHIEYTLRSFVRFSDFFFFLEKVTLQILIFLTKIKWM